MPQHESRKLFAIEKAMMRDQATAPSGASMPAASGGSSFEILQELNALRGEVSELKGMMQPGGGADGATMVPAMSEDMNTDLRLELAQMVRIIARAKSELAAIKHPHADDDQIMAASNELDAIVLATETATNDILEATENVEKELTGIAALAHDEEDVLVSVDKIMSQLTRVMEACNFQDITGQRITKVVRTMQFIEERILAMIDIWGTEAFLDLPVPPSSTGDEGEDPDADLLHGPQMEGEAISQAEIDALFD